MLLYMTLSGERPFNGNPALRGVGTHVLYTYRLILSFSSDKLQYPMVIRFRRCVGHEVGLPFSILVPSASVNYRFWLGLMIREFAL